MSEYRELRKQMRLKLSRAQHRACIFLERHGQRFLIDFGYKNAIDKARYIRAEEREKDLGSRASS